MHRRTPTERFKFNDQRGVGTCLLTLLNKFVFVLLMAMILHLFSIHNGALPPTASVSRQTPGQAQPSTLQRSVDNQAPTQAAALPVKEEQSPAEWIKVKAGAEIRIEPDVSKPVLLVAAANDTFPLLRQSGDWSEVSLGADQQGWFPNSLAAAIQAPAAHNQILLVPSDTPLYLGPDDSFAQASQAAADRSLVPKKVSGQWIELAQQKDGSPLWVKASQAAWTSGEQPAQAAWSRDVEAPSADAAPKPQLPLAGKTVVVDPGHGGNDPGAIANIKPIYERDVNLAAALVLANKLKSAGANVIMTRTSNEQSVSLQQRAQISNDKKADVFVSIHQNMYQKDPTVSGTITYYDSPDSKLLAQKIEAAATRELNSRQENEQIEKEQLYVLKHNRRPAVLIEGCFLSNPGELAASLLPAYQEKLAAGIYQGIIAYLHSS